MPVHIDDEMRLVPVTEPSYPCAAALVDVQTTKLSSLYAAESTAVQSATQSSLCAAELMPEQTTKPSSLCAAASKCYHKLLCHANHRVFCSPYCSIDLRQHKLDVVGIDEVNIKAHCNQFIE